MSTNSKIESNTSTPPTTMKHVQSVIHELRLYRFRAPYYQFDGHTRQGFMFTRGGFVYSTNNVILVRVHVPGAPDDDMNTPPDKISRVLASGFLAQFDADDTNWRGLPKQLNRRWDSSSACRKGCGQPASTYFGPCDFCHGTGWMQDPMIRLGNAWIKDQFFRLVVATIRSGIRYVSAEIGADASPYLFASDNIGPQIRIAARPCHLDSDIEEINEHD